MAGGAKGGSLAGAVEKLGIHWSGQLGESQGKLYLDADAVSNEPLVSNDVLLCVCVCLWLYMLLLGAHRRLPGFGMRFLVAVSMCLTAPPEPWLEFHMGIFSLLSDTVALPLAYTSLCCDQRHTGVASKASGVPHNSSNDPSVQCA